MEIHNLQLWKPGRLSYSTDNMNILSSLVDQRVKEKTNELSLKDP